MTNINTALKTELIRRIRTLEKAAKAHADEIEAMNNANETNNKSLFAIGCTLRATMNRLSRMQTTIEAVSALKFPGEPLTAPEASDRRKDAPESDTVRDHKNAPEMLALFRHLYALCN